MKTIIPISQSIDKPRYTLIWSEIWEEWVCIDITNKPDGMTARQFLLSDYALTPEKHFKYLTN